VFHDLFLEQNELIPEFEYLLSLDFKDINILSYSRFENEYIRFMLLVVFKNIKIKQIYENKQLSDKAKFSKGLKHVEILNKFLPEIDECNRNEIDICLNNIHDILSNFYSGDEFPFNAVWELLQKLAGYISKFLSSNGYQPLMWKIIHLIEKVFKSLSLNDECFKSLYTSIKIQMVWFTKQNSFDPKVLDYFKTIEAEI